MKRVLIALVISIFLGVFGTIGTAWLCAELSEAGAGYGPDSLLESTGSWSVSASRRIGVWHGAAMISQDSSPALHIDDPNIPEWSRLRDLPEYTRGDPMPVLYDWGYGWPLLSMWSSLDAQRDWNTGNVLSGHVSGTFGDLQLPIRILVWGFAGDVAFFTIVFLLILILPRRMRRWWRGLRGHCHACGYDLRNDLSAGCPECGWRRDIASSQRDIKEA